MEYARAIAWYVDEEPGCSILCGVRRVRGRSQRSLWLVAGVAVTVALVAGTWWLLVKDSTAKGSDIATVLALPLAVLGLLAAVVAVIIAVRQATAEGERLLSAAQRLAGDVRKQEEAALARLVADTGDPRPADVAFAQPSLLYWRTDGGDREGSLAQIASYYRGLERGRLVVLGEAGAGKTVLAIALVRDLAAAIVKTPPSPEGAGGRVVVPVRLSLPAFDPVPGEGNLDEIPAECVAKQLEKWLASHLSTVYGMAEATAAALVAQGWILPVLDGLDEMDPAKAWPWRGAAVLRALNYPTGLGLRPVVLTCRTGRYAQLIGHLDLADGTGAEVGDGAVPGGEPLVVQDTTVVSVEPLSVPDVLAYLAYRFPDPADPSRCEQRWRPVVDRLSACHDDDPLVAALRSPLRLFLAATGYRLPSTDPEVLTRYTTTELDNHLFSLLIPAVTAQHRRRPGGRYAASDVQRWLSTLARHLRREDQAGRSGSDLRLDELWRVTGGRVPRYLAATMLTFACAAVLAVGVVQVGLSYDVPTVVAVAGGVLLVAGSARGSLSHSVNLQRVDLGALRTSAGRRRLALGLAVGFAFWLMVGLMVGLMLGLIAGLTVGLALGLAAGLAFGLALGLEVRPAAIDFPRRLVSQGLVHMATMLAVGLIGGLAVGLIGGLALGLMVGLAFWLTVGPTLGLAFGLWLVRRSPWPRYAVTCWLLARRRELPHRPAVFLDWAYDAGLVRLSGISVQFRHREFQAWLASTDQKPKPPTPPLSPPSPAGAGTPVR